ncbi:MAG: MBL fold metallo-hydrolase [Gaiellaceae bacterium]
MERLGAEVFVPPPDAFNDDVAWLRGDLERLKSEGRVFSAGDRLPVGVEAFPGMASNDLVLWVESRRALVVGDPLSTAGTASSSRPTGRATEHRGRRLTRACRPSRSSRGRTPLLELPVELVLPTHGRRPIEPPSSTRSPDARSRPRGPDRR